MSGRNILLLTDHAGKDGLMSGLNGNAAIYAMTPGAMLCCEELGLDFMTGEDLYSATEFRSDTALLQTRTEELFSLMDGMAEGDAGFHRAYSSNIYWFLILFNDLFYMTEICDRIRERYDDIAIMGPSSLNGPVDLRIVHNLNCFMPGFVGFENKVRMLSRLFPGCRWSDNRETRRYHQALDGRWISHKMARLGAKAAALRRYAGCAVCGDLKRFIVVQDGYEVEAIKKRMRRARFLSLQRVMSGAIKATRTVRESRPCPDVVKEFISDNFPAFEKDIVGLFELYGRDVVPRIRAVSAGFSEAIERHEPAALLYSQGARGVYEELYAFIASQRGIPVFYFQHGGSVQAFHEDPYQKYHEHNTHVKKAQIYQSRVERDICVKELGEAAGVVCGSAQYFKMFRMRDPEGPAGERILFGPTVFNFNGWKKLLYNAPDNEIYGVHKDIVSTASELSVKLDIKVHPGQADYQSLYFTALAKRSGGDIRVIRDIPVEAIFGDYRLLVLDNIDTMLIQIAFLYPIPVILYFKDNTILNPLTRGDLESRCYFVESRKGLRDRLLEFKDGKLETRYSEEMIDKYVFPFDGVDPADKIASFITGDHSLVLSGMLKGGLS